MRNKYGINQIKVDLLTSLPVRVMGGKYTSGYWSLGWGCSSLLSEILSPLNKFVGEPQGGDAGPLRAILSLLCQKRKNICHLLDIFLLLLLNQLK